MAKKVFNNGRSVHLPFSNDMEQYGAEYDMNTVSKLLDENIPLDELKQQLKGREIKASRKRNDIKIVDDNDNLVVKEHHTPNESVDVDHLYSLDKNYRLADGLDYTNKYKKKNKNPEISKDGMTLATSAGQIHINNDLANKYVNGKKRLKIKNQYVTDNQLLNCTDEFNIKNIEDDIDPKLSINNCIEIPVRDRSNNQNYTAKYQLPNNIQDNNIKKSFPYGELALPSNGKTVIDNNYRSNIDWEKTVCTNFGCNKDDFIVPEKYYQNNQNIPRTADEWENLSIQGNNRFNEKLPNANISSDNGTSLSLDNTNMTALLQGDNMNHNIPPDEDGFIPVGNGVNYSPRMHLNIQPENMAQQSMGNNINQPGIAPLNIGIDSSIFDQKKIHEQQLQEFGEYVKSQTPKEILSEAKNHQGMTVAIALSLKIRDLKVLVTEFSKNVNKIDHCVYDQMNETLFRMLKNAAKIKRHTHHKTTIYELDADAEFFRDLIKLSVSLQYMSPKKGLYGRCVALIDEIGRLIGGMIRNINKYEDKKKK